MDLQSIVDMAKQIEYYRKSRDLLREVQICINNGNKTLSDKLMKDINKFFNYEEKRHD